MQKKFYNIDPFAFNTYGSKYDFIEISMRKLTCFRPMKLFLTWSLSSVNIFLMSLQWSLLAPLKTNKQKQRQEWK